MALFQSAVSELLKASRAVEGVDLIRESVRMVLPELLGTEAAQVILDGRSRWLAACTGRTPELLAIGWRLPRSIHQLS